MKSVLLILCFSAIGTLLFVQTEIKGQILTESGMPIYHAMIMLEGSFDGSFTDEHGNYILTTTLTGDQFLIIKKHRL